jgi:hypothetical protein
LLGGEKLLTSKKYSKEHVTIENLKGLIVSNDEIDEKRVEIKKALLNRLFIINFLNKNLNPNKNINEYLIQEEPQIIIYCNKLYFKYFGKKQKRCKITLKNLDNACLTNKNKFSMSLTKFIFSGVLGKINGTNKDRQFKSKFIDHTNTLFKLKESNNGILIEQNINIALTNTTELKHGNV